MNTLNAAQRDNVYDQHASLVEMRHPYKNVSTYPKDRPKKIGNVAKNETGFPTPSVDKHNVFVPASSIRLTCVSICQPQHCLRTHMPCVIHRMLFFKGISSRRFHRIYHMLSI